MRRPDRCRPRFPAWTHGGEPGHFPDLHNRFITHLGEASNAVLPPPYFAAIANRVPVEESERRSTDANVFEATGLERPPTGSSGGVATLSGPGLLTIPAEAPADEPMEEAFLEIQSSPGGERLVTAVEVLSLSNKGAGTSNRAAYRQKQRELRAAGVNLVEIDLLRAGRHTTLAAERELQRAAAGYVYHTSVFDAAQPTDVTVAPVRLPDRLPTIPIPLSAGVFVSVDLQPVLDRCYDAGLYARRVQYADPCDPPLIADQQTWADGILRTKAPRA